VLRYGKDEKPDKEGTIKHAGVMLEGTNFALMDSAHAHNFTFNEAISFIVYCNTQEEIDYFWSKLSADPKAGQCGWLKDKFSLSWQIVPTVMDQMLQDNNQTRLARVTQAFLKMKKFDIAKLKEAYDQGGPAT
jgi:predicted 3-demethylubiquinone-9 3-methyltransferase (glyoxalase superfamily)